MTGHLHRHVNTSFTETGLENLYVGQEDDSCVLFVCLSKCDTHYLPTAMSQHWKLPRLTVVLQGLRVSKSADHIMRCKSPMFSPSVEGGAGICCEGCSSLTKSMTRFLSSRYNFKRKSKSWLHDNSYNLFPDPTEPLNRGNYARI